MPERVTNVTVLVEDVEQQNLVRRFLQRWLGNEYVDRRVRYVSLPAATGGAGERHVRKNYPIEVRALRSSLGKRVSGMLLVMIDADRNATADRHRQLAAELEQARCGRRNSTDPIFVFVPKRHVETWIRALQGVVVDEQTDYKRPKPTSDEIRQAAIALCDALGSDLSTSPWPESLNDSAPEWRRVPR